MHLCAKNCLGANRNEKQGRPIRDGEIWRVNRWSADTAIVFGNLNDPDSQVAKLKKRPRNYNVLNSLNTRMNDLPGEFEKIKTKEMPDYRVPKGYRKRAYSDKQKIQSVIKRILSFFSLSDVFEIKT